MSDVRISELPAATLPLTGAELVPVVQSGVTKQTSVTTVGTGVTNVKRYGAVGDGVANDAAAIQAASTAVFNAGGGTVYFPRGTYKIESSVTVDRGVIFSGEGFGSAIVGSGAGVVFSNAQASSMNYAGAQNLRIYRSDASGVALDVSGAVADGTTRWFLNNVYLIRTDGKNGTGLRISGSWNITMTNVLISGWDIGMQINQNTGVAAALNSAAFVGGQIEGNNTGLDLNACLGINFIGTAIELNSTIGVDADAAYNLNFKGCYFEANGTADIRVGNSAACFSVVIDGNYFNTPAVSGLANSIIGANVTGLAVVNNRFERYTAEPISITGASVTGEARNNTKTTANTVGMVTLAAGCDRFSYVDADRTAKGIELTIASGAVTPTTDFHIVDTEGDAATDDLDTINNGVNGMVLRLQAANGARTVVLTEAGNIVCPGASVSLDNADDMVTLVYSESRGKWIVSAFSDNGA